MKFVSARWRARGALLFGIDLRTLALFRVALASVLAVLMLNRLPWAGAFYSDWGVLPRAYLMQTDGWSRISLFLVNGEAWFAGLLILAMLAASVALWFGYRTRLAVGVLFVLFISLINRNPLLLIGGDILVACVLFWSLFLPLGARWSVDAALSTTPPPALNRHVSPASAGLILQVLSVYFFSAIMKNGADWFDGTAVYYTMELERYASPLGRGVLREFPGIMAALSHYVWFLELLGPVLALSPWATRHLRFLVMLGLMAMHTGFALFMEIGHFPYVSLSSLTILLGGWFWDWRARANEARFPNGPKIFYDEDCGFCLKSCRLLQTFLVLPRASIAPAQSTQRAKALLEANYSWVIIDAEDRAHLKWRGFVALLRESPVFGWLWPLLRAPILEKPGNVVYDWVGRNRGAFGKITAALLPERAVRFEGGGVGRWISGLFVVMLVGWNLGTIDSFNRTVLMFETPIFRLLRIDQIWNMFAPYPSRLDGWLVYPGKLEDGTAVDVLKPNQPLSWDRPPQLSQVYENIAWHTYRWRLLDRQFHGHFLYYAKYLCREWNWNAPVGKRLLSFEMNYLQELTPPPGQSAEVERKVAWIHDCRPRDVEDEKRERRERKQDPVKAERSRPV
ncbi:MAG TPA: DCC1-like thiol-disulfide oxidoreductase family protein [Verrucomicrobiae bacterium]|nr:DCC1-like thiol-disulfide oxidoreductase family protein [Verrucomicrobiae bacterium]